MMSNLQETALRQGATKSEYESMLDRRSISSLHIDRIVGCFGRSLCPDVCEGDDLKDEGGPTDDLV